MFRTVRLSIIRSFSLYTQQWYMSQRFADSLRAGSGCNCRSSVHHQEFSLYTQQWYMSYRFADSLRAGSEWNCTYILILLASCQQACITHTIAVYSEKFLMMDKETVRNMQSIIPRIHLRNQCTQLVLLQEKYNQLIHYFNNCTVNLFIVFVITNNFTVISSKYMSQQCLFT